VLDAIERRPAIAVPVLQHVSGNPAEHRKRSANKEDPRPDVHLRSVSDCWPAVYRMLDQRIPSSAKRRAREGNGLKFVLATRNDDVLISPDAHRRQAKALATIAGHGEGAAGNDARSPRRAPETDHRHEPPLQ
jgi:hypothetical protein